MIERKEKGLILIGGHASIQPGLWIIGTARPRGFKRCVWSGSAIVKGDRVYRPLSNSNLRGQRILADVAELVIKRGW